MTPLRTDIFRAKDLSIPCNYLDNCIDITFAVKDGGNGNGRGTITIDATCGFNNFK